MNFDKSRDCRSIPSLIKWTGSKRAQARHILSLVPEHDKYFEPFLGGGAMMFFLASSRAVGNDIYKPLIDLWLIVQSRPEELIDDYKRKWHLWKDNRNESSNFYHLVRKRFNKTHCPLDLNFILRTCLNGLVKFNKKKEFITSHYPFHYSSRSRLGMRPDTFAKHVRLWTQRIQGVDFLCQDYREVISQATRNDFVYLDPPYARIKVFYTSQIQPESLFNELEKLNSRGVKWALSYEGRRGTSDFTYDVPKSLYKNLHYLFSGYSPTQRLLNRPLEKLEEALYTNY